MSGVTEISFLCDKAILQTTAIAQVGRRASDFVQVGLRPATVPSKMTHMLK